MEDSLQTPRTEQYIGERSVLAKKERAVGLSNQYQRVTTLEQAVSMIDPSADLSKVGNTNLRSGSEAVLRTNVRNGPVNFIRTSFQEARNKAKVLSKKYITNNKTGAVSLLRQLDQDEKNGVAAVMQGASKHQVELSDANLVELGLNDKQIAAVKAIRDMPDVRYAEAMKAAGEQGYEGFQYRKGYLPSMFSGAYIKFVGELNKDGKFVTKGIAQSDTKAGLKAALEAYAKQGWTETIDGNYRGLKESTGVNRMYNGFAAVVAIEKLVQKQKQLKQEIAKVIVGQDEVINQIVLSVFSGGHALLVGVPGLAKTLMVNTISQALGLHFKRIQFTPDLMPSDILGSEILDESRSFKFIKGPIFSNIILADEINRTPPKTQAALLEAMQEKSVTVAGHHYKLDLPFFVLATQNPIEQEGTYPLPEAQLDRFMFAIKLDYPSFLQKKKLTMFRKMM